MAIEKMVLVNLHGALDRLDEVLAACSGLGCFHPEPVQKLVKNSKSMTVLAQDNPYEAKMDRLRAIASQAGLQPAYNQADGLTVQPDDNFLQSFEEQLNRLADIRRELTTAIEQQENVLKHLAHIGNLDVSLDELFASRFAKVRFGRLPADSYPKLKYYDDEVFFFHPFDFDGDYYWCCYLTTGEFEAVTDNIFASLYFERIFIPNYAHGTPRLASAALQTRLEKEKRRLAHIDEARDKLVARSKEAFGRLWSRTYYLNLTYEIRKYVAVSNDVAGKTFHMVGFIPAREQKRFGERLAGFPKVTVNFMPPEADGRFVPPTRLHNNPVVRPFEMFVTMYGIPSQTDIDPTPFVAVTYSLLFGAMFGDLGQGMLLSVLGLIIQKVMKAQLGGIMLRVGLCSAVFGLLYGSVFGFEDALDPLYHALGLAGKPIHVMDGATINQILIFAVAAGAVIIVLSILINIVQGIRQRDMERAVLSANGIAGLVMYGALLVGLVCQMFLDIRVFVPAYIILFVAVPALLIFCKEPLLRLLRRAKRIAPEDGIGGYIAESFFELFEIFLSFAANTMSFLRVGGFVLSHAGMMLVVFTLSDMLSGASVPVIILGNLFVMALEGMIVGIQVLRLEFYEMFSRFFQGEGVPFEPISFEAGSGTE
ncbi:V-type ATP synthase subunit I [Intestinibacillus massiliensis]|uniref:V-type ATP synthase subunit I n=1 Tax=Intestinibacillus massiliensis TaxID=1871029 RepID=UPI000B356913|nr:V-type ATPase 116kDa subunit family protein [Intestinibacillus massiliensis]MCB6367080.1 V-type ATP synthase subunit I [Intestinibacillus massiliensis]